MLEKYAKPTSTTPATPSERSADASASASSSAPASKAATTATSPTSSGPSIVDKYAKRNAPPEVEDDGSGPYKAYGVAIAETRQILEFLLADGNSSGASYSYINGFDLTRKKGRDTVFIYSALGTIALYGRNLRELKNKLCTHSLLWVREFNPKNDENPADGEPIITRFAFLNKKAGDNEGDDEEE